MKTILLYLEGIRTAIGSLRAHKLRTILTMLGVSIGIFAITIIFTLVNSLNYNLNSNLSRLGNSVLFVYHFPWSSESFNNWQKYVKRPKMSYNEFLKLDKNLDNVEGVCYDVRIPGQTLKYKNEGIRTLEVRCVTGNYLDLNGWAIEEGRPFTELEMEAGRPVCVLGYNVAKKLFGDLSPIGRDVKLKGRKMRVIGVVEKSGTNMFGTTPDDLYYVPYAYATRLFDMNSRRLDKYIMVKAKNTARLDEIENDIIGLLRASRGLRPRAENDFSINRPEMLLDVFSQATDYLWYGGLFISFFAVVVGGFGIGNIMFTTVQERTFEIGLQKALGAKGSFILFQFLIESVILCLIGGLIGLLLNYGAAALLQAGIDSAEVNFQVVISSGSIVFGIVLSLVIGLGSGLIPSRIASRMDPIESMRK